MKYPCVEATIETPCKGSGKMRLWIERTTELTSQELDEIAELVWSYDRETQAFVNAYGEKAPDDFVSVLIDEIPGLSAVQICLETSSERMALQVGQVVYVKDFATDPHG